MVLNPGQIVERHLDDLAFEVLILRASPPKVAERKHPPSNKFDVLYLDDQSLECDVPVEELLPPGTAAGDPNSLYEPPTAGAAPPGTGRGRAMVRFDLEDLTRLGLEKIKDKGLWGGEEEDAGPPTFRGPQDVAHHFIPSDLGPQDVAQIRRDEVMGGTSVSPLKNMGATAPATVVVSGAEGSMVFDGKSKYRDTSDGTKIVTYVNGVEPVSTEDEEMQESRSGGDPKSRSPRGNGSRAGRKKASEHARFDEFGNFVPSSGSDDNMMIDSCATAEHEEEVDESPGNASFGRPFGAKETRKMINELTLAEAQQAYSSGSRIMGSSSRPSSSASNVVESDLDLRSLASDQSNVGLRGIQTLSKMKSSGGGSSAAGTTAGGNTHYGIGGAPG